MTKIPTPWMTLDSVRSLLGANGRRKCLAGAELAEMPRYRLEQPRQNERDDKDADDARHLMAHEVKSVIAPVVEDLEKVFLGVMRAEQKGCQLLEGER